MAILTLYYIVRDYNIARVLVLSNSHCVIMIKTFMYARPCSINDVSINNGPVSNSP